MVETSSRLVGVTHIIITINRHIRLSPSADTGQRERGPWTGTEIGKRLLLRARVRVDRGAPCGLAREPPSAWLGGRGPAAGMRLDCRWVREGGRGGFVMASWALNKEDA